MQKSYYVLCILTLAAGHCCTSVLAAPFLYVVNGGSNSVSVIDTAINKVIATIPDVAPTPPGGPFFIAVTRDGKKGFVTNPNVIGAPPSGTTVTPLDLITNTVAGAAITTGIAPIAIATPNTCKSTTAYVTHVASNYVTPIDVATNGTGPNIALSGGSDDIALTKDGKTAYVSLGNDGTVIRIDTATNTVIGEPIPVGNGAGFMVLSPDGTTLYIGIFNVSFGQIVTIDVATNMVVGNPIAVQAGVEQLAITPDGRYLYVTSLFTPIMSVVDTTKRETVSSIIFGSDFSLGVAITDTGKTAYVSVPNVQAVYPVDIATNTIGDPIKVGSGPIFLALSPLFLATGTVKDNIFLDHTERIMDITWTPSPSNPKLYRIYRDGIAIGNVPATQPRQFFVPLQGNTTPVFTITAVAQDNSESRPMLVC